jgi:Sugar phosphate permease
MSNSSELSGNSIKSSSKYIILILLFLGWCIGNLDRFAINYAIVGIAKDFHLNASLQGLVMSSFFIGYAIMQIPGGWLADKYGPKKVMMVIVFVWSLFTGLTGLAWSFIALVTFRLVFGLSEGSFFPTASKSIAQVFPQKQQGKAISILLVSGLIIAAVSSVLFAWIIGSVGWRALFFMIGAFGIVIIILFIFFFKLPQVEQTEAIVGGKKKGSLREVVKNPVIWCMFLAGFSATLIMWGVNSWVPSYLVKARGLTLMQAGKMQVMPILFAVSGQLFIGYLIDKMKTNTVKITAIIMAVLCAISLFVMYKTPSLTSFIIFEGIAIACACSATVVQSNLIMRRVPQRIVATSMGLYNLGSQIGGFTAPLAMGIIVDANKGSFGPSFLFLTIGATIGAIAFLATFLDRKQPSIADVKAVVQ